MKKYGFVVFLLLQILFLQFLKRNPEFVETYYSNFLYKKISLFSRQIFGFAKFSVGDIAYAIVIIAIAVWLFFKIKTKKIFILQIVNFISVFYFAFHLLWGYNYYRAPLAEKMEINTNYTDDELFLFTEKMIQNINKTHLLITKKANAKVVVPYSTEQIIDFSIVGYINLSKKFAYFTHQNQALKASIFSKPLSYMGFAGYLNPFTNEAQVNSEMPKYVFAMTSTHEMAHQIGFASESECNFIGYLACIANDDLYVRYSAESFALRYCLRFIKIKNPLRYKQLYSKINSGIIKNYNESDDFWKAHESFVEVGFKTFYDQFLKANQQKDGLEGYGKFLNLLIGFERSEKLEIRGKKLEVRGKK